MSDWQDIGLLGSTTYQATATAPGPTVSYASAGGTTLVAAGYAVQGAGPPSGPFSAAHGLTAITDTAGNAWQFSLVNSQKPPAIFGPFSDNTVTFIAWCINAAPVTSVTFADYGGAVDTWNISLSEWANIAWPGSGYAGGSGFGAYAYATGSTRVYTPKSLVAGVLTTNAGTITSTPPNTANLPGEVSTGAVSLRYAIAPTPPASTFAYSGPGGTNGTTGGSTITSIGPPIDLVAGDLLILDVVAYNATVTGWPTGFVQQLQVTGAMDPLNQRFVATKLADGSEVTNMTVTLSGASNASAGLYSVRGAASPVPLNTATFTDGSGYKTNLGNPSLTINDPADATIYGYGGISAARTGFLSATIPGVLSNSQGSFLGQGTAAWIGWGVNVTPVSAGTVTTAVDTLDWGMDFAPQPMGVGGYVNWPWTLSSGVYHTWVMQSFGPCDIRGAQIPSSSSMASF